MWGEIRRGWQEAAMGVSGQGEKSLSPDTQKTITTMQLGRHSINTVCTSDARVSGAHETIL